VDVDTVRALLSLTVIEHRKKIRAGQWNTHELSILAADRLQHYTASRNSRSNRSIAINQKDPDLRFPNILRLGQRMRLYMLARKTLAAEDYL
jgi:hypothetical protein